MSSQVMAESYGLVPCSRVTPIYLLENVPFTKTTALTSLHDVTIPNDFFYYNYYLNGDIHYVGMQLRSICMCLGL